MDFIQFWKGSRTIFYALSVKMRMTVALYVKKFGGSSVATPEKMRNIANRILSEKKPDDQIVIVISAMRTARMICWLSPDR